MQPGSQPPDTVEAESEPGHASDPGGARPDQGTARPGDGTEYIPPAGDPGFGRRPMFRDDAPEGGSGQGSSEHSTTAQIDITALDDFSASRGRTRKMLLGAGFVVLLLLGGGGAFLVATTAGSDAGPTGGGADKVADESTDPGPLKPGQLFPDNVDVAGETYTLAIDDDTDECDTAARKGYASTLTENDCRQVVRASYVNDDKTQAVTVGVAAMSTAENAKEAQDAQDLKASQWFAGLNGKKGSGAERMQYAAGQGSGAQWGRYLLFSLAANNDGRVAQADSGKLGKVGDGFVDASFKSLRKRAKD